MIKTKTKNVGQQTRYLEQNMHLCKCKVPQDAFLAPLFEATALGLIRRLRSDHSVMIS